MSEYKDDKNMIDIGKHTGNPENDSSDDLIQMAGDFAKAAGGIASSFGKFAAKKGDELKSKLDDDNLQDKFNSGIKTITDKIDEYVASDSELDRRIINVKGVIDIEEPKSAPEVKPATEANHKVESVEPYELSVDVDIAGSDDNVVFEAETAQKKSSQKEKKSAISDLRNELRERAEEDKEYNEAVKSEKKRLAAAREKARNGNVFRKIKLVDNAMSKKEIERDNQALAAFKAAEQKKLSDERSRRGKALASRNKKPIAAVLSGLLVAACATGGIATHSHNVAMAADYDQAVTYIMSGDYDDATEILEDNDYEDAEALYEYADLQNSIESYQGATYLFLCGMEDIDGIENGEVKKQYEDACEEVKLADEIQDNIDSLELESLESIDKDTVDRIGVQTSKLDKRYSQLLNTDQYDLAAQVLTNVDQQNDAGKLITGIDELGEITLDSKDKLDGLQAIYDKLSESDKKTILNYSALTDAESTYAVLRKAEDDRIAAEKKAAEEKAAAEKKAQEEREEAERLAAEAAKEQMVWVSRTGECYHSNPYCSRMKDPWQIPLSDAERTRRPCKKCY